MSCPADGIVHPPLTEFQVAAILRAAVDPKNCFLPADHPIRVEFLIQLVNALIDVECVTGDPRGDLRDERIQLNREILRIGCPRPGIEGGILWNLGIGLSDRFDEEGTRQDLEESISVFRNCLDIANHSKPRWTRLLQVGSQQTKLCILFDLTSRIDETISILNECLVVRSTMSDLDSKLI